MKVPMPTELGRGELCEDGVYCAIGWIAKHCCGMDAAKWDRGSSEVYEAVKEKFEQPIDWIWQMNDELGVDRLEKFRKICARLGLEIE